MKKYNIKKMVLIYVIAVSVLMSGCAHNNGSKIGDTGSGSDNNSDNASGSTSDSTADSDINLNDIGPECFSDRDYDAAYDEGEAHKIDVSDGDVSITDEGTYILSGDMKTGKVVVNAPNKKVQIVLAGCSIISEDSCPFIIEEADKVFLTLADGSVNTVADAASYDETIGDSTVDGAIFSKADLTINGSGTLEVTGTYKHGIVSKDDITITGGNINVTSVKSGIVGKDCVQIGGGKINVSAGTHAISSTNEEDKSRGYVYIYSGDISLDAGKKGIKAMSGLIIDGGSIHVDRSYEGLESAIIKINGGNIDIVSSDDGINASNMYSEGNEQFEGDKDWKNDKPDAERNMPDGDVEMTKGGGTDGNVNVTDGSKADGYVNMTDENGVDGDKKMRKGNRPDRDGNMPEDGRMDENGNMHKGGRPGGDGSMSGDGAPCELTINGGTITIDASGDGIDSNGTLNMNGGQVYVSGPSSHGNCAIDYNSEAVITGGTIIAAGSSGMAQNFGQSSTQASMMVMTGSQKKDSTIKVTDSSGNEIISWQSPKEYDCVVISSPNLDVGSEYVIQAGDYEENVELTDIIYGDGSRGRW